MWPEGSQERAHHPAPHAPGSQVEASSPGQGRWLRDYCTSGLYILTLLLEGYGFSEETWPGIEFRKQVTTGPRARGAQGLRGQQPTELTSPCVPQAGGMDIGWTLGYMLNLTGMIPAEVPAQWRAQSHGVWAAGVTFATLTLVLTLGAVASQLLWPRG